MLVQTMQKATGRVIGPLVLLAGGAAMAFPAAMATYVPAVPGETAFAAGKVLVGLASLAILWGLWATPKDKMAAVRFRAMAPFGARCQPAQQRVVIRIRRHR